MEDSIIWARLHKWWTAKEEDESTAREEAQVSQRGPEH
jgi:hypothetical protein